MALICTLPTHLLAESIHTARTSVSGWHETNPSQTSERGYVKQDDGKIFCDEENILGRECVGQMRAVVSA